MEEFCGTSQALALGLRWSRYAAAGSCGIGRLAGRASPPARLLSPQPTETGGGQCNTWRVAHDDADAIPCIGCTEQSGINKHERAHWKASKRTGDALPGQVQAVIEAGAALVTKAKGLGRGR